MKKLSVILKLLTISIIGSILFQVFYIDNKDRILDNFSNNLYQYPLPPNTEIIEITKFDGKNFIDGGGSGGYWNVGATMKLSTSLKREDILTYYKGVKFSFPKSNKLGVEPEIYFDDDLQKVIYDKSFRDNQEKYYYRDKNGGINTISTYFNENRELRILDKKGGVDSQTSIFIVQILSGYDYFLNID